MAWRSSTRRFARRDRFAAELIYLSECAQRDLQPEPSGLEGMIDVKITEAPRFSAETGRAPVVPPRAAAVAALAGSASR